MYSTHCALGKADYASLAPETGARRSKAGSPGNLRGCGRGTPVGEEFASGVAAGAASRYTA